MLFLGHSELGYRPSCPWNQEFHPESSPMLWVSVFPHIKWEGRRSSEVLPSSNAWKAEDLRSGLTYQDPFGFNWHKQKKEEQIGS